MQNYAVNNSTEWVHLSAASYIW